MGPGVGYTRVWRPIIQPPTGNRIGSAKNSFVNTNMAEDIARGQLTRGEHFSQGKSTEGREDSQSGAIPQAWLPKQQYELPGTSTPGTEKANTGVSARFAAYWLPPPSRISVSIRFVFRSTAKTMVRCSTPSAELATSGITWRLSGMFIRTVNVPSART